MHKFLRKINSDKVKIAQNKNPIKMKTFLSFLTIETTVPEGDWLGKCRGWTRIHGEGGLDITGGIVGGIEYLDHILYGKNLENPYNNYVTPFSLFDIMTEVGKAFFFAYYSGEIKSILANAERQEQLAISENKAIVEFWGGIGFDTLPVPTKDEVNK